MADSGPQKKSTCKVNKISEAFAYAERLRYGSTQAQQTAHAILQNYHRLMNKRAQRSIHEHALQMRSRSSSIKFAVHCCSYFKAEPVDAFRKILLGDSLQAGLRGQMASIQQTRLFLHIFLGKIYIYLSIYVNCLTFV
jgi:hypothetical protein